MSNLRIEITDDGTALYVSVDPSVAVAKTTQPDELITVDWDAQGNVAGIEIIGSLVKTALAAFAQAITSSDALADPGAVREVVQAIIDPSV
jgi:YD repeat-containing protein